MKPPPLTPPDLNGLVKSKSLWDWDNFFKLIGAIGIASWTIQEWVIPHDKVFLFITVVCFVADVFYIVIHKFLPHKRALCVLGWIIYFCCVYLIYKNSAEKNTAKTHDFSIRTSWMSNDTNFMRYIDDNGQIVPFAGAVIVEFTNLKPIPIMINSYEVEIQTADGKWIESDIIPKYGINRGRVLMGYNAFTNLAEVDYTSFDSAIQNKNIAPNETVRGWLFFKSYFFWHPTRFSLRDMLGNISTEQFPSASGTTNEWKGWPSQDLLQKRTGKSVDFRSLSIAPQ
jgi:hypothetical protein